MRTTRYPARPKHSAGGSALQQLFEQLLPAKSKMPGHLRQYCRESAKLQWRVIRNGDVVFAALLGCKPEMASSLPAGLVTQYPEQFGELRSREIAGEFHTAMTSSRTKCNRMIFGWAPSSK